MCLVHSRKWQMTKYLGWTKMSRILWCSGTSSKPHSFPWRVWSVGVSMGYLPQHVWGLFLTDSTPSLITILKWVYSEHLWEKSFGTLKSKIKFRNLKFIKRGRGAYQMEAQLITLKYVQKWGLCFDYGIPYEWIFRESLKCPDQTKQVYYIPLKYDVVTALTV